MAFLSYLNFFAFISYAYMAIYLLMHNRHASINGACALFLVCLALWSLPFARAFYPGTTADTFQLWVNVGSFGWIGIAYAFLWFALLFTGKTKVAGSRWYHGLSLALVAILVVMQWRGLIIGNIIPSPFGWTYGYVDSFWMPVCLIYLVGAFCVALFFFYRFAVTRNRRIERWQGIKLFVFTLISVILATILNVILPLLKISVLPPLGNVTTLIWAGWLIYTVIKYKTLTITPVTAAESILATMSDMLILCDPDGIIVTVNQATCDRMGGRRDKIESRHITRFFTAFDETAGQTIDEIGQDRIENCRMRLGTLNNKTIPVILSSSPFRDKFSELAGTIIVARDITSVLEAEKALMQSELRYRELVENINDVIYAVDTAGKVTYLNPRIQELTGHRPDELIGCNITKIIHEDDLERLYAKRKEVLASHSASTEGRIVKKDGKIIWVQASARPIMENDRIVGIQGILTDINERVHAQREKHQLEIRLHKAQKMEAIGTLAGGVAHDLNNILSGIVSYPDLLLMDLADKSPLREPLEVIKKSGRKAATIVQDLLTLARRNVVNQKVINLNDVINEFLDSPEHHKQLARFPVATIKQQLAQNLPAVKGSRVHLAKIVMNLLSNALEALPVGQGRVTITTAKYHLDRPIKGKEDMRVGDYVMLQVADTGTGIAEKDLDRIFEPFYTKKMMGRSGTGLGMAVVWGTVKDHNGHIEVKSETGLGTVITLYFPVTRELPEKAPDATLLSTLMGRGQTILVIDDESDQCLIAASMLTRLGYSALTADSGQLALEVVKSQPVDLLLLDMIMAPGWDGLETYERILKVRPGLKAVIASGYSETDRVRQALCLGAGVYIKKPYTLEEIAKVVNQIIGHVSN